MYRNQEYPKILFEYSKYFSPLWFLSVSKNIDYPNSLIFRYQTINQKISENWPHHENAVKKVLVQQ